jgi:hypothetical protein
MVRNDPTAALRGSTIKVVALDVGVTLRGEGAVRWKEGSSG